MILALVSALTMGQCLLASYLLGQKGQRRKLYWPLAAFFAVLAVIQFYFIVRQPIYGGSQLAFHSELTLCKQLIELSLAPFFWVYVRELTSEHAKGLKLSDLWHFLSPLMIALTVSTTYLIWSNVIASDNASPGANPFVDVLNAVLNVVILSQLLGYAACVIRRLKRHQRRLQDLFANSNKLMELSWFRWVLVIILGTLLLEVVAQLLGFTYDVPDILLIWNSLLRALIIWSLAAWGLKQSPDLMIELAKSQKQNPSVQKYLKSALSSSQLVDVSNKIRTAVEGRKLYQDANLSLRTLSEEINVLPNYASQALNTEIKESFFDYINRLRVEDAMSRLRESDSTVLAISEVVGFNSRSSFYTAFKKVTGKTPTAYRNDSLKP